MKKDKYCVCQGATTKYGIGDMTVVKKFSNLKDAKKFYHQIENKEADYINEYVNTYLFNICTNPIIQHRITGFGDADFGDAEEVGLLYKRK
jgi:hypothetical protein